MALKYFPASITSIDSPPDYYKNMLQEAVNANFENAPNYYVIDEEITKGSKVYTQTGVRLVHVINSLGSGQDLPNDWKQIIFKDFDHARAMGSRYKFDDNIWLTVKLETYKNVTASCSVRRCNNALRWIDENGAIQIEPCIIEYTITNFENDKSKIILPDGAIQVIAQGNNFTKNISLNQRFIFNDQVFKVQTKNNLLSDNTFDSNPPLITLYMYKDEHNMEMDNFNLGIANYYQNQYDIEISQDSFSQSVGYNRTLTATVKFNGEVVDRPIFWESSNSSIATINGITGELNLLSVGNVMITATVDENVFATDNIIIQVSNTITESKSNIILPQETRLIQTKTQIYTIESYTNGVLNSDTFTITASGVPETYYNLMILNGNTFTVTNNKMHNQPLVIQCVNNTDSTIETISIQLAGLY